MQAKDYFTHIREFDHKLGIYLTFTLDKEVINKIRENSSGRTVILHDYRQGLSLDEAWKNRVLCIPFLSQSLRAETCFHSKLTLLKGKEQARLLIGSMNLSKSSFSGLKEVCYSIDLDYSSPLYEAVISYFRKLPVELMKQHWINVLDELSIINKNRVSDSTSNEPTFISNIDNDASIASMLLRHVKTFAFKDNPVLRIATPFLSKSYGSHLIDFIDALRPQATFLYLRDRTKVTNELIESCGNGIKIVRPKAAKKAFHAKIVMIEYAKSALVYVGSANFTKQGFFLSHKNLGNLENGVIISFSDKKEIMEWFSKGWEKPVDVAEWNSKAVESMKEDLVSPSYAWGEKKANNHIEIYLFLSNPELIDEAEFEGKKLRFKKIDTRLFKSEVISTKDVITIRLREDNITFHVFDAISFENAKRDDGESLFSIDNNILEETVREDILKEELAKKGIKIGSRGVNIIEPPLLEQYYYNAKHLIRLIQKKKTFDESHRKELELELAKQYGATGIYLAMHLYGIFEQKGLKEFSIVCSSKLDELFQSIPILTGKYKPFLNQWIIPNG